MKKVLTLILVALTILTFSTTALAAGERMTWDGRAKYSFISDSSVPQRTDRQLLAIAWNYGTSDFYVRACEGKTTNYVSGQYHVLPNHESGMYAYIPLAKSSYIRRIHIESWNGKSSYGRVTNTLAGEATLFAN